MSWRSQLQGQLDEAGFAWTVEELDGMVDELVVFLRDKVNTLSYPTADPYGTQIDAERATTLRWLADALAKENTL